MKTILFTGGGSAGHVVPNLAVMNEIRYSHRVLYMGTGGIEKTLVTQSGFPFFQVDCPKLERRFTLSNFAIPLRLRRAVSEAKKILEQLRPDLVFSKGGYASFPAVNAAYRLKIPVLTHESDLSPGLCTKLIARKCRLVLTSFPETALRFKNGRHVGSPVRRETLCGDRDRARRKYGFSAEKPVLLVLGGGSGSRTVNAAVREALPLLLPHWYVLHLCGKGNAMENPPQGYVQREFESDMGSAYSCSDVVLARAGSNTVFEALALGKRAVYVPLERNSRGDQLENALYFQRKKLCALLRESELSPEAIETAVNAAYSDETMRAALLRAQFQNATPTIVALIKEYASPRSTDTKSPVLSDCKH